jgi:hypothetical protein
MSLLRMPAPDVLRPSYLSVMLITILTATCCCIAVGAFASNFYPMRQ